MSAIFAGINTPYINQSTLKRVMSNRQKDNIFQGIITRPNEACTEKYSEDTDAAEIQVIRVVPDGVPARQIGADINGGFFPNTEASQPTTEAYGIRILVTVDDMTDIPTNQQNMINVDLAEATLRNLYGKVDRNVNALTLAAQAATVLSALAATSPSGNLVELPASPQASDYLAALLTANAYLDDGNIAQGIDTYPRDQRAIFLRSTYNAALKKGGNIYVNSNYGQIMVKTGALDPDTKLEPVINYVGTVDDTPCYVASNPIWSLMEKFLGFTVGALDGIQAMVVSAIGTGRALAFNDNIKMIDAPGGQGIRIQPKYRMGAECWDALSVVPIVSNGFTNPVQSGQTVTPVAPGSQSYTITYNGNGNTGGTAPSAQSSLTYNQVVQAAANSGTLVKTSNTFNGWNTKADGTGTAYAVGANITVTGNMVLYAAWQAD